MKYSIKITGILLVFFCAFSQPVHQKMERTWRKRAVKKTLKIKK